MNYNIESFDKLCHQQNITYNEQLSKIISFMSTKSHKLINASLSTTTVNNAGMSSKTKLKSTAAVSGKKIARDLREEFDQFQLREDPGQQAESSVGDAGSVGEMNEQQQQTNNKALRNQIKNNPNPKKTLQKPLPPSPSPSPSSIPPATQIPKSYITAMQHLQDLLQMKNEQINKLKNELIDKQQLILDSQSRINQILIKYHQLMDMYSRKQNQITFLKDQIDQLNIDKQVTLKHAAKVLGGQIKVSMYRQGREWNQDGGRGREEGIFNEVSIARRRAMSSNGFGNAHRQVWTAGANKQFENPTPTPAKTIIDSQPLLTPHQPLQAKISTQQIRLPQSHRPSPLMQLSQTPLLLKSNLNSNLNSTHNLGQVSSTNRDFISYQREVLRNQKQLIALKYRMECLQRKLVTNPKEDGVKTKIRRLSQEIQTKERMISNLKNM